ncbi:hypothetical protein [Planctomycetes bacterium K23_9]|uniref:Adhesin domain-containing protein n=1 Tax=Stieleria marina TaxID=1930275 RepID=A0A517NRT3_9BACT|nr:hypothetical protein K239x_17920 [Planctomycetes bacterium K23_9]
MTRIPSAVLLFFAFAVPFADAEDRLKASAQAPANHVSFRSTATGGLYVDQELMAEYVAAKDRYESLRRNRYRSADFLGLAAEEFLAAEKKFVALAAKVESAAVLVSPFTVYRRRETESFQLGSSNQIVITADDVNLRGWNGDDIKCVVEKAVLGTESPDDAEFDAIKVEHEVRPADDWVGVTDEVRKQQEDAFLESKSGKDATEAGLKFRKELIEKNREHYSVYRPLQGQRVNTLQVVGLSAQEGNVHLTGEIVSPGGGKSMSGYWRRSAKVTIYVPKCQYVAVRGCMVAVNIKSVQANLILTTDGSLDRSYGADFHVSDIDGDLSIRQAPIRRIIGIQGDVQFIQTDEVTNTSTRHSGGVRTTSSPPPDPTLIGDIGGNLNGHFVRADLSLRNLRGEISVFNEYGNTQIDVAANLKNTTHRIASHSGVIRLSGQAVPDDYPDLEVNDLVGVPLHAFTQTGTVKVRGLRKRLQDKSYTSGGRGWQGFRSPTDGVSFTDFNRPNAAWENSPRSAGIDIVSSAGTVVIESKRH